METLTYNPTKPEASELYQKLFNLRGAKMVTIIGYTQPALIGGKSCPFHGVMKRSRVNGVINWSYQNAVNNQRCREGQPLDNQGEVEFFEPEARRWGERLHEAMASRKRLTPLVKHTLKATGEIRYYLEYKVERSIEHQYILNGKVVPNDQVEPHLRNNEEGKRQEVDNPVILRDYMLQNIERITMDGVDYQVAVN